MKLDLCSAKCSQTWFSTELGSGICMALQHGAMGVGGAGNSSAGCFPAQWKSKTRAELLCMGGLWVWEWLRERVGLVWVACSSRGMGEEGEFPTLLPPPWTASAAKASTSVLALSNIRVDGKLRVRNGREIPDITPKALWNLNCFLSYILSGFVVLGGIMILCWVRYRYCGSGITYSKPCWQSGITKALQLCRWEHIGCVWPKTLVEFKLVVSYFSITRWLNIDAYIHTHWAFVSRAM